MQDIGSEEGLRRVLGATLGAESSARLLQQSAEPGAKQRLEQNTKRALDKGCFGAPWFEVRTRKRTTEENKS